MLARFGRRDRDQRVRVIWRGDRHSINIIAIQEFAVVDDLIQLASVLTLELASPLGEHATIAIADRDQMIRESIDVIVAATVEPNHRHPNFAVDVRPRNAGQKPRSRPHRPLLARIVVD